jgi:hypothetical protein
MASMKNVAAKQKKNAKLILHIILELANKFGLAIDKNTLKNMTSNGNDIEAKRNEASILRHFLYRSETNKLILKL